MNVILRSLTILNTYSLSPAPFPQTLHFSSPPSLKHQNHYDHFRTSPILHPLSSQHLPQILFLHCSKELLGITKPNSSFIFLAKKDPIVLIRIIPQEFRSRKQKIG